MPAKFVKSSASKFWCFAPLHHAVQKLRRCGFCPPAPTCLPSFGADVGIQVPSSIGSPGSAAREIFFIMTKAAATPAAEGFTGANDNHDKVLAMLRLVNWPYSRHPRSQRSLYVNCLYICILLLQFQSESCIPNPMFNLV